MREIDLERPLADQRELRNAFGRYATGVAVVSTRGDAGALIGLTCNSFAAVSLDPPLALWSLRNDARSIDAFKAATHFAVSVLGAEQGALSSHFASAHGDKFADIPHRYGHGDCPVVLGALATFECAMESTARGGDHTIFVGRVRRAAYRDGDALIFSAGAYRKAVALET